MNRLHVGKGSHHHLHFERLEDRDVALEVVIANLDIRLSKEAKNLREQGALAIGHAIRGPILDIGAKRYFLAHPMGLLLALPGLIGPGVTLDIVGRCR
jgi:hypothetical protein